MLTATIEPITPEPKLAEVIVLHPIPVAPAGPDTLAVADVDTQFVAMVAAEGIHIGTPEQTVSAALTVCDLYAEEQDVMDIVDGLVTWTNFDPQDALAFVGIAISMYFADYPGV